MSMCSFFRELDLEGDLVGVPHTWYLLTQSFITLKKMFEQSRTCRLWIFPYCVLTLGAVRADIGNISIQFRPPDRLPGEWFHLGNSEVTCMEIVKNWLAQRRGTIMRPFRQRTPSGQRNRSSRCLNYSGNFLLVLYCQHDFNDIMTLKVFSWDRKL